MSVQRWYILRVHPTRRYVSIPRHSDIMNYQFDWYNIRRVQPTRCKVSQFIYFCKKLYMFQTGFFRPSSAQNCTYSVKYLSHKYCYLHFILSSTYNVFKCVRPKNVSCVDKINEICCAWWEAPVSILIWFTHKGSEFYDKVWCFAFGNN